MEGQILFNIVIGLAGDAMGWVLKLVWDTVSELKKDVKTMTADLRTELKELNREVNQDFVRREDFKESISDLKADMKEGFREVKDAISMLFDRVNEKVDKT